MAQGAGLLSSLALILLGGRLAGALSNRIGMPAVLGKLLAGLAIGPAFLGLVHMDASLNGFAQVGVILLMFVAGLETDTRELRRVGAAASLAAVGGVVLPLAAGTVVARAAGYPFREALFTGAVLTATSVSITAQTLQELGYLKTRVGAAVLGAAVIDDVLGILVLAVVMGLDAGGNLALPMLKLVVFIPAATLVSLWAVPLMMRHVDRLRGAEVRLGIALALVLFYAWSAEELGGVAAITGAYLAGIALARTGARDHTSDAVRTLAEGFFVPIFFVSVSLSLSRADLAAAPLFTVALVGVAIVTKLVGSGLGALAGRMPAGDALRVGVGMISRGEVALVVATVGRESGLVSPVIFSAAVVVTVVTTVVTPLLLRLVYRGASAPAPAGVLSAAAVAE